MTEPFTCGEGCMYVVHDDTGKPKGACKEHDLEWKRVETAQEWTTRNRLDEIVRRAAEAKQARRAAEMYWALWREKNRSIIRWKLGRLRVSVSWRK